MTNNEIQQEISIIKEMIAKSRKETAESGLFFICIGIFSVVITFVIGLLEIFKLNHLVLPVLVIMTIGCGLIGFLTINKKEKKANAKSYPKTLCYNIWLACSITLIIITFILPVLKIIPWNAVAILASTVLGIAIFSSGIIFESKIVTWCSAIWWAGAIIMALIPGTPRMFIMMAIILFGWVLPGVVLNRQYKNRSK